jgi:hypothetical protein
MTTAPKTTAGIGLNSVFLFKMTCVEREENDGFDICGRVLIVLSYILVVITFPIAAFYCINVSFRY